MDDLQVILEYCEKVNTEAVGDYMESGDRMDLGRALGIGEVRSYCKGMLAMREGA